SYSQIDLTPEKSDRKSSAKRTDKSDAELCSRPTVNPVSETVSQPAHSKYIPDASADFITASATHLVQPALRT
ncbi:MAG: hypothetical protein K2M77_03180, partial [Muribaculaceae bacterium]|nr:hypothetical protein [Muribaculaceae bacterium]